MLNRVFGKKSRGINGGNEKPARILERVCPLFVIGCPRSGSTLLAKVLNSHPLVLMTNETAVFLMLNEIISKSRQGVAAGMLYGKEHNELWADHLIDNAKSLIESYYHKIIDAEGKTSLKYWGEKHPHNFECLTFITSLYPDARYIYIIRDPRDSACSIRELIGTNHDSAIEGLKFTAEAYEAFSEQLSDDRLLRVRYEDLVEDYLGRFQRIFQWLGLKCLPEVEQFIAERKNVDAHGMLPDAQIDFSLRSVGRWKREFSQDEERYAGLMMGDYMERYGYPVLS